MDLIPLVQLSTVVLMVLGLSTINGNTVTVAAQVPAQPNGDGEVAFLIKLEIQLYHSLGLFRHYVLQNVHEKRLLFQVQIYPVRERLE